MFQLSLLDDPLVPITQRYALQPRDYQLRGIEKAFELWAGGSIGVIFRQPTGSGKTVSGTLIADLWLQQGDDYHVMVLAHERQLVTQFADEIEDILKLRPAIEMGQEYRVAGQYLPKIVVASRATLYEKTVESEWGNESASRLYKFDNKLNWLVILDECHRWAYKLKSCRHILNWFGENPNSRRLGLTATPERGDKTSLRRILPEVASDYRLYDLDGGPCAVLDGWAVAYDQRFITVEGVDFKNLRDVRGDFDDNQLDEILSEDNKTLIGMVQATLDLVENRRTIIFCPTVDFAKRTAKTINAKLQDYRAAVELDGAVPDQARKDVYKRHQRGEFQFLCVCGLCREGYNDPGIQAVAIYRPTKSRGLAEQMKGRGCRPLRGVVDGLSTPEQRLAAIAASDKPNCMIIDLVGVTGLADCASTAHILASGKPDEVIERANQNALRKNGPCNMADEIKKAESELAAEKVERDTQLRLRQLREEEELRKLGKLVTDVRYSQQKVQIGGGGSVQSRAGRVRMLFGKHKGKPLDQVPTGYLQWIAKEAKTKPWFKQACKNELDSRLGKEQHGHRTLDVDYVNRLLREP